MTWIQEERYGYPIATTAFKGRISSVTVQFSHNFDREWTTGGRADFLLGGSRTCDL